MTVHITRQGEMLDLVCYRHYGPRPGIVERVLDHNKGLAALGPVPPAGTRIELPVIPTTLTPAATIKLWD